MHTPPTGAFTLLVHAVQYSWPWLASGAVGVARSRWVVHEAGRHVSDGGARDGEDHCPGARAIEVFDDELVEPGGDQWVVRVGAHSLVGVAACRSQSHRRLATCIALEPVTEASHA